MSPILPPPPSDINPNGLAFDVPIPDKWFPRRYQLTKAAWLELKNYEEECATATEQSARMRPGGRTETGTITVCCPRGGRTKTCLLLQVGGYSHLPSLDVLMEMWKGLVDYAIVEKPNLYPIYEKF